MLLALSIYLVLRGSPAGAGVAVGLMLGARPPTLFAGIGLVGYGLWRDPRWGMRMLGLVGATLLPLVAYNYWYFGSAQGGYAWIQATNRELHFVDSSWSTAVTDGLAGLLVSPSRGLLVYSPVLVFALAALVWVAVRGPLRLEHFLAGGFVLGLLLVSRYSVWWGGHSFGPRYLADFLPLLAVFLLPAMACVERSRLLATAFVCLLAVSVAVQAIGVLCYPSPRAVEWNKTPRDVDATPARLWDWKDSQLVRLLHNGPRPPGFAPAE
jgi:hypothetical protein